MRRMTPCECTSCMVLNRSTSSTRRGRKACQNDEEIEAGIKNAHVKKIEAILT